jgi:hypothetical protein
MEPIPPEIRTIMTTVRAEIEASDIADVINLAAGIEADIPDDGGDYVWYWAEAEYPRRQGREGKVDLHRGPGGASHGTQLL